MKRFVLGLTAAVFSASMAMAAGLELTPANPQPKVRSGLSVSYSLGARPRSISQARAEFSGQPGKTLPGLQWPDQGKGANVMTSDVYERISAKISGYIKFDSAGDYELEFYANDGLRVEIGGQRITTIDGIGPCRSAGPKTVSVPQAGWYKFDAFYFQKEGTACLEAEWARAGGSYQLIPDSAFGH
ncbi:PA14 domain-containing protein [Shimia biformata]|uniref:PA14 domain-containing protein n=1 Tax=Shimia biformata TaxID=1294299 RepID=UPI00194F2FC7|nr:PA14 domain-containing protein [Shimia biformata]